MDFGMVKKLQRMAASSNWQLYHSKTRNTASNLHKMGVGSIVMVTVGTNKKGCLNQKVAPHNAKIEELQQLGFAVSKDPDGENLQLQPEMTMKDIDTYLRMLFPQLFTHIDGMSHNIKDDDDNDGEPNSGSFPWFLIVKSSKNMVKNQFIYFGTVHEVSDELDETMEDDSEIDTGNEDKQNMLSTRSRTKENKSNMKPQRAKLTFEPKKRARSNSPLFGEMSDSDIEFVGPRLSPSPETMLGLVDEPKRKQRQVVTTGATDLFMTLNINDDSEVGTEAIVKAETELLKELHSTTEENNIIKTDAVATGILSYDFGGPYDHLGNFDDNIQVVEPSPASSILTDSSATNVVSSTANSHKELDSGHPQGSRAHAKTQASSSRLTFDMLLKPKNNPWLRK
ncbi:hypothetical protein EDB19DRAFT_1828327 [Suillus lakei]|nr:hypothetical protein EDB19DRAFT_1828327 [Suillus lakei]